MEYICNVSEKYKQKSIFDFSGPGLFEARTDTMNTPSPEQDLIFNLWMSGEQAQNKINPVEAPAAYQVIDSLNWNLYHAWQGTRAAGAQA